MSCVSSTSRTCVQYRDNVSLQNEIDNRRNGFKPIFHHQIAKNKIHALERKITPLTSIGWEMVAKVAKIMSKCKTEEKWDVVIKMA